MSEKKEENDLIEGKSIDKKRMKDGHTRINS